MINFYLNICNLASCTNKKSAKLDKLIFVKILKKNKSSKSNLLIEELRKKILNNNDYLIVDDLGAGSKVQKNNKKQISKIAKYSVSNVEKCRILSALVEFFDSHNILELGTSLGISTLYVKFSQNNPHVTTIEGSASIANLAKNNFNKCNADIELIVSNFDDFLNICIEQKRKFDFILIDGNHSKEATLRYFEISKKILNGNAIIFFDDIRWSKGMKEAWKEIIRNKNVEYYFDCLFFGFVKMRF